MLINTRLLKRQLEAILPSPVCSFAHTGEQALEMLTSGEGVFELAILDHYYGNEAHALTGLDVTLRVREAKIASASGAELPIIGSSGNEGPSYSQEAFAAGQNAVWGKPLPNRSELERDLRRVLHLETAD